MTDPSRSDLRVADRLARAGLVLPRPLQVPPGARLPFEPVRLVGTRAIVSGHGPTDADGKVCGPFGKVGADVTEEQAYDAARRTGLAVLASLERALGDLDRIAGWTRVFGMVNSAPGFTRQPAVVNGFSDLVLEVFGPRVGAHARSAVGMAELPWNIPVEVEAEVELRP
jgi:enamine deaminase RidA (YjgF/YER057c/UK114 family)